MLSLFAPAIIGVIIFSEIFHGSDVSTDKILSNPYLYGTIILIILFRFINNIIWILLLGNVAFFTLAYYLT